LPLATWVALFLKAILQDLYIEKREACGDNNEQNNSSAEAFYHIKDKDKSKTVEFKEEVIILKDTQEDEDDELSRMFNDIRSVIN